VRVDLAEPTDRYTVSFWFRNDVDNKRQAVTAYMFSFGDATGKPGPGDHLGLSGKVNKTAPGRLFLFNGPANKDVLTGEATLRERSWHHVVFVREGDRVRAYIIGGKDPDFDGEVPRTSGSSKSLFIGGRSDRFGTLNGAIAHVAFFNRALSPDEAEQLHAHSGQPKGPGKQLPAPKKQPSVQERFAAKPGRALAMGVRDKAKPADCKINIKGESKKLGPLVRRGFLSACETNDAPSIDPTSSGRLALARWLTRGDHPQTARVMVNRVWIHLFGRGIVTTPDDFGVYGSRPSHPQLLDHLATRFVQDGWSTKKLIRTIVLSRTYQLSSHASEASIDADPEARWMSRHKRRRMDAETLRDSMLMVSGQLNRTPGEGSAIQHMDVLVNKHGSLHKPSNHRSVYLCMMRNSPPPELAAFDLPRFINVKGQRNVTTLPSQSLYLLNSRFVVQQAEHFARRLVASDAETDEARVHVAYQLALNRQPRSNEAESAVALVRSASASTGDADRDEGKDVGAWAVLCQALLASNEFRYVD